MSAQNPAQNESFSDYLYYIRSSAYASLAIVLSFALALNMMLALFNMFDLRFTLASVGTPAALLIGFFIFVNYKESFRSQRAKK